MHLAVLHCPTNVGSNPSELAAAERRLGMASKALVLQTSAVTSAADGELFDTRLRGFAREKARLAALCAVPRSYDVVHFNFGSTFAPAREERVLRTYRGGGVAKLHNIYAESLELACLAYLRARGVRVFVTFQGDDARHVNAGMIFHRLAGAILHQA